MSDWTHVKRTTRPENILLTPITTGATMNTPVLLPVQCLDKNTPPVHDSYLYPTLPADEHFVNRWLVLIKRGFQLNTWNQLMNGTLHCVHEPVATNVAPLMTRCHLWL